MGKGYSQDLRERVIDAVVEGKLSRREAAARFGVSDSSAIRWVARYLQTGARGIIGTGGHRPSKLKPHREWLLHVLEVEPDITLMALSTRFFNERGVKATTGMLSYFYIGEGIRFKKNRPRQRTGSAGCRSAPHALEEPAGEARSPAPGVHR